LLLLLLGSLSSRNDPNHVALPSVAEAYEQHPEPDGKPDHQKPIFVAGMIGIRRNERPFVEEYRLRFFEGDVMLLLIGAVLVRVPLKLRRFRSSMLSMGSIHTMYL